MYFSCNDNLIEIEIYFGDGIKGNFDCRLDIVLYAISRSPILLLLYLVRLAKY